MERRRHEHAHPHDSAAPRAPRGATGVDDDFVARGFANSVTDGIRAALERATEAAKGHDVRLGGGAATIRQYLRPGSSTRRMSRSARCSWGSGEHLFAGLDLPALGYDCTAHVGTAHATHVVLTKRRER